MLKFWFKSVSWCKSYFIFSVCPIVPKDEARLNYVNELSSFITVLCAQLFFTYVSDMFIYLAVVYFHVTRCADVSVPASLKGDWCFDSCFPILFILLYIASQLRLSSIYFLNWEKMTELNTFREASYQVLFFFYQFIE